MAEPTDVQMIDLQFDPRWRTPDPEMAPTNQDPFGWVVHHVVDPRQNAAPVWAWCKVRIAEHGYDEIRVTQPDGHTPADLPPGALRLGPVIVKLWC